MWTTFGQATRWEGAVMPRLWSCTAWIGAVLVWLLGAGLLLGTTVSCSSAPEADAEDGASVWTCSMHPSVQLDAPGACPLCGMDLIEATGQPEAAGKVVLSERARVLAQLQTTAVQRQAATADLRLLGRIEPAETTRRNVTTWVGGRIDRLRVNTTGEELRRGEAVATLYSPEVYAAHQDLLSAQAQVERFASAAEGAQGAALQALEAARERLRLLGVPERELEVLAKADQPTRALTIRSPFAGTVIERVATEGAYVETGATLYRVADLSTLWVQLDAYERDLEQLAVGQTVSLAVEALPEAQFEGRVSFIEPTVDPRLRTAGVRVEVENPDGRLRPGMFAQAEVRGLPDASMPLVVPASAPLFTGRRSVVYVEEQTDNGPVYAPRTVRLGTRLGEVYPVVSGLSEGERVVSRGAFALDADLQIRGGPSMMSVAEHAETTAERTPVALRPADRARRAPVVQAYLDVQVALAEDDLGRSVQAAGVLGEAVSAVGLPAPVQADWSAVAARLQEHAAALAASDDLPAARGAFEPLSAQLEGLLARFGNPLDVPVRVAFCPMAMDNEGARWVQQGEVVDNAYYGSMMRRCGEISAVIDPGTLLDPSVVSSGSPGDPHAGHAP